MEQKKARQATRRKQRRAVLEPPNRRQLQHWERVCRYIDAQPFRSVMVPFPDDPPITARLLKRMAGYHLVHHREDCRWRLSLQWRDILRRLWQGTPEEPPEEEPLTETQDAPFVADAGPDTMYVNVLADAMPPALIRACDHFKTQAQARDETAETPWLIGEAPLSMLKAGKGTTKKEGVSWGYVMRNEMVEVKLRKVAIGGIAGVVRLGSRFLWTYGARDALDQMRVLIQCLWLWEYDPEADDEIADPAYQLSQLHLCADVVNFRPQPSDLPRIVTHSISMAVHVPSEDDEANAWREPVDDEPYGDPWEMEAYDEPDPYDAICGRI